MKFNIFQKPQDSFGLHLNGTALKFAQIEKNKGQMSFTGFSNVPMPKNLISNDTILDGEALSHLIEQSLLRPQVGRITTNRVVASIPEPKSFIRVITIPEMSEAQA